MRVGRGRSQTVGHTAHTQRVARRSRRRPRMLQRTQAGFELLTGVSQGVTLSFEKTHGHGPW